MVNFCVKGPSQRHAYDTIVLATGVLVMQFYCILSSQTHSMRDLALNPEEMSPSDHVVITVISPLLKTPHSRDRTCSMFPGQHNWSDPTHHKSERAGRKGQGIGTRLIVIRDYKILPLSWIVSGLNGAGWLAIILQKYHNLCFVPQMYSRLAL